MPLLLVMPPLADQLAGSDKLPFCCNVQPETFCHEMVIVFPDCEMFSVGAPGICTTEIKLQNPPVTEKLPPAIAPPASGWPIVPMMEKGPLVLVPPPLEILCQLMEYCCAKAAVEICSAPANKNILVRLKFTRPC